MTTSKYSLMSIAKRFFIAAIAATAVPAVANNQPDTDKEWVCRANANGEWQCNPSTNPADIAPVTTASTAKAATSITHRPSSQWDWVYKDQLEDISLCKTGCDGAYIAPPSDWEDANKEPDTAPLRASANNSNLEGSTAFLSGAVELTQGHRRLKADNAVLDRDNNQLRVEGNIEIREPGLLIRADKARINTENNFGHFEQALFLQHDSGLRGQARFIERASASALDLQQGSMTQCSPDDETWIIYASDVHLNNKEGWGSAKHAKLKLNDIPVLYTPYMTFPIDDRRKSGLLFPTLAQSNSNGFEISIPVYLNLAADFDATFTPRFIEKRGTMLEGELRQISRHGSWVAAGAMLKDDQYKADGSIGANSSDSPPREERWVGRITHNGKLGSMTTKLDYNKVSDEKFFDDLTPDSLALIRSDHLIQTVSLGYRDNNWQAKLIAQQYQTIDDLLSSQYQFMPRLTIEKNSSGANFSPEWLFEAEFTDFKHDQSIEQGGSFVTGKRSFAEAGISYPTRWTPGFIIPTVKLRSISYDLNSFQPGADQTPSVTTPLATLDMGLVFERETQFANSNYLQTLEPRVYYFYSDYKAQDDNPTFDTRALKFSYSQLFRDTRFTGHDRLDDANQASLGITSRFINDSEGREVLNISLGQIFYFNNRRVQLNSATAADVSSNSQIASEVQYQPTDRLWLTNTLLWDSRQDYLQEGGLSMHYQASNNSLYNLGYRFNRAAAGNSQDLSQADASAVVPINERWSSFARYRYDIEENRAIDDMVGLQYEDCCWMVRMLYQRSLKNENNLVAERDYAFILEFELKGLGSLGNKARNLLKENILGYEDLD